MSSFYSDASIVLIPSGYKDQKIYCAKPTDGTGDLTFSRASSATRVQSDGLIEKVRTNLVLQSETFETTWAAQTATITSNATTAPNGTLTADKLVAAVGAGTAVQHRVDQTPTTAAGNNTYSVYAKKGEIEFIFFRIGLSGAMFNLNNGAISNISAGIVASSVDAGNGWYRLIITKAASIANEVLRINLNQTATFTDFIGNGTDGAFIWGAQYELSDIATPYIPTTTAAVSVGPVANLPRIDYTGGGCGKLLLEPQRTNLALFSESFDNAAYTKTGATIAANVAVSPDGYTNADKLVEDTNLTNHRVFSGANVTASTTYTSSVFVKKDEINAVQIIETQLGGCTFNLDNGTITSGTGGFIQNYGNGWFRCGITRTTGVGQITFVTQIRLSKGGTTTYTGNGVDGLYLWGAQTELGAYATSYINTLAASVTRGADACSKTGISSLIGQSEGTIFLQFNNRLLASYPNEYIVQIISGTTQLWVRKEFASNTYTVRLIVSGVTIWTFSNVSIPNGNVKLAACYKTGDSAIYLNGAQVSTTNTAAFSGSAFSDLNFNFGGTLNPELPLDQALLFKTRIPNSELASLTTL